MLYELLTGQPPFTGASVAEILRKVQEQEPDAPLARKSVISCQWSVVSSQISDLQTVCLKCLQKEPAKRYATAQDLADDLERFLNDEPILARPVTTMERIRRWCRRRPAIACLSAGLVLALLAGFAGTLWQLQQARQNASENLRQIAQMPRGIPVATVAIGGAENAGLLAAQMAGRYPAIADRVKAFRKTQTETVLHSPEARGSVAVIRPRARSRHRS